MMGYGRGRAPARALSSDTPGVLTHLGLLALGLFQVFPLLAVLLNSFRTDSEIKLLPIGIPKIFYWQNYIETWIKGDYGVAFRNSIIVGGLTVFIVVICAGLAGFALIKLNLPGKSFFTAYFLMAIALPGFLYIVPDFYLFNRLKLVNNLLGITIIYAANAIPFNLLLIRTFLIGLPKEMDEAARIDGCGELGVFRHIILPLAKPIFTTVALLVFVQTWNEFLWANTFLQDDAIRTVATKFIRFTGEWTRDLAKIFTSSVITLAPIVILYLFLQKTFIEGMVQGGVKG